MLSERAFGCMRAQPRALGAVLKAGCTSRCARKLSASRPRREQPTPAAAALATPPASSSQAPQQGEQHAPKLSPLSPPKQQRLAAAELLDEKLYEELRSCDAWPDVLDIVQDEGSNMSTKRLVQALTRFGALLKAAPRDRNQATSSAQFQQLLQLLYTRLPALKPSQASAVAMGLSQLHVRPSEQQLLQLMTVLGTHAAQFSARDVATVMHAMVALGPSPEAARPMLNALSSRAKSILQAQLKGKQDTDQVSQQGQQGEAAAASTVGEPDQQASSTASTAAPVSGLAANHQQQQQQQQQQHRPKWDGRNQQQPGTEDAFTPQGLSMVLGAAAHLKYGDKALLTSATDVVLQHLPDFTPQGVANVMWATASQDFYQPALIQASLEFFVARRGAFKAQEVSNFAWALTRLRHHPQQYGQALTVALLSQQEGSLRPADLVSLLQLLATFCIIPGKRVVDQLCRLLDGLVPQCSAAELCNSLWSLGLMGETSRPVFARIAALLPPYFERGELNDGLLRQTFQALLCATLGESAALEQQQQKEATAASTSGRSATPANISPVSTGSSIPAFPPLMLDTMKRLWVSTIQGGALQAEKSVSPTKTVSEAVGKLKVRHDAARSTRDGLVLIDIALRPSESRYVALQILRGFDHTRNTDQLLGPTQLERQILEKNGWETKYLLYQDLQQIAPEAQLFFIAEYLKNIGCRLQRSVPAPGTQPTAADKAAAARAASRPATSEAAREANLLLKDPRANYGPRKGKRS